MKIETLEYIHKLLREDVDNKAAACRDARDLQHTYEEHDSMDLAKEQKAFVDECMKLRFAAVGALNDFEQHDWK